MRGSIFYRTAASPGCGYSDVLADEEKIAEFAENAEEGKENNTFWFSAVCALSAVKPQHAARRSERARRGLGGRRVPALLRIVALGAADGGGAAVCRCRRDGGGRRRHLGGARALRLARGVRGASEDWSGWGRWGRRAGGAGGAGRAGGADDAGWAAQEQAGVAGAAEQTRRRLAAANRDYEDRFGYIFIVCATGRSADEMLSLLEVRLRHDADGELPVAAEEQRQITRLRLNKLVEQEPDITS
jgi:hypothetical protein